MHSLVPKVQWEILRSDKKVQRWDLSPQTDEVGCESYQPNTERTPNHIGGTCTHQLYPRFMWFQKTLARFPWSRLSTQKIPAKHGSPSLNENKVANRISYDARRSGLFSEYLGLNRLTFGFIDSRKDLHAMRGYALEQFNEIGPKSFILSYCKAIWSILRKTTTQSTRLHKPIQLSRSLALEYSNSSPYRHKLKNKGQRSTQPWKLHFSLTTKKTLPMPFSVMQHFQRYLFRCFLPIKLSSLNSTEASSGAHRSGAHRKKKIGVF